MSQPKLTECELKKLVMAIQSEVSKRLGKSREVILAEIARIPAMPKGIEVTDEQKKERKEREKARNELKQNLSRTMYAMDEFHKISHALENLGISIVYKSYPFLVEESYWSSKRHSDLWNDFVLNKMCDVIIRFDKTHEKRRDKTRDAKFTGYVMGCLANYCRPDRVEGYISLRTNSIDENDDADHKTSDTVGDKRTVCPDEIVESKEILEQTLQLRIAVLDLLKTREERKLVYHCKRFLGKICRYCPKALFAEWKGKPLGTVSNLIENKYSERLGWETMFMNKINEKMRMAGTNQDGFLGKVPNVSTYISTCIRDINNSLRIAFSKIIENINYHPDLVGREGELRKLLEEL